MKKKHKWEYKGRTYRKRRKDVINKLKSRGQITRSTQVKKIIFDKRATKMPKFKAIVIK